MGWSSKQAVVFICLPPINSPLIGGLDSCNPRNWKGLLLGGTPIRIPNLQFTIKKRHTYIDWYQIHLLVEANEDFLIWLLVGRSNLSFFLPGGGFKHFLFPSLPGEMIQVDEHIFQMGWFIHHLASQFWRSYQSYHYFSIPKGSMFGILTYTFGWFSWGNVAKYTVRPMDTMGLGWNSTTNYPWTPKPWKMKVLHPEYMGYNP